MSGHKNAYDCIKAFSETDFTEDLKKFDVPTLIIHGDDDQIVPIGASAMLSSKLVKDATLKIYKGGTHSLGDTSKDQLNADLLAFLQLRRSKSVSRQYRGDRPWLISLERAMAAIVLVHGGFVDGSGWEGVYRILKKDGYQVSIVQNPTISLADDVAVTKRVLAAQDGPVILVGHSYGGVVITEAGNDPKVAGLVYIAAFAPDKGESVASLIKDPPPGAPVPPILPPQDGFLFLDKAKFAASFAGDVAADKADVHGQFPGAVGRGRARPARSASRRGRAKPSWYLVATDDQMIPPAAQRLMSKRAGATVVEVAGSHAVYVSQPQAVAALIKQAAQGVGSSSKR